MLSKLVRLGLWGRESVLLAVAVVQPPWLAKLPLVQQPVGSQVSLHAADW